MNELIWDDKLSIIAEEHSWDLAKNNFFSHDNLKGESLTDRAVRHRYSLRKHLGEDWIIQGIGENIGLVPTGVVSALALVKNQVGVWMDSPSHRKIF